jgi:hypothetical protein
MKKNAMLKIAAILLVAVLLTTCAISATFAKYVSAPGTDTASARVAKWGLTVKSSFMSDNVLFDDAYGAADTSSATAGNVVAAEAVVAPGTTNTLTIQNVVEGNPEVSGKIVITADVTFTGKWKDSTDADYCPLEFKIGDGEWTAMPAGGVEAFATAIEQAITTNGTTYFTAEDDPSNLATELTIAWRWDFHSSAANDAKDTALANYTGSDVPGLNILFTVNVEQTGSDTTPITPAA